MAGTKNLKSRIGKTRKRKARKRKIRLTPLGKLTVGVVAVSILVLLGFAIFHKEDDGMHPNRYHTDRICYLAAKYESNGKAESVGEDVAYQAYGEYQLYYAYELVPFVNWCYERDPSFYQAFADYREMSREKIPGTDFRIVWKQLAADNYRKFEEDQQTYLIETTLREACETLTEAQGYDFVHADDAVKACVLSVANRQGKYLRNLQRIFHSANADSTAKEVITNAYAEMQYYRSGERRWLREEADCLALLEGTLNIYEKSENDAGGIDWRWKE